MPASKRDAFLLAFSRFPSHQFIWRFTLPAAAVNDSNSEDKDAEAARALRQLFAAHPNVHPFTWLPQREILGRNYK
jgi:hypothetical protein